MYEELISRRLDAIFYNVLKLQQIFCNHYSYNSTPIIKLLTNIFRAYLQVIYRPNIIIFIGQKLSLYKSSIQIATITKVMRKRKP